MGIYEQLVYRTDAYIDRSSWIGNLRWYAVCLPDAGDWRFDVVAQKGEPFSLTTLHPRVGGIREVAYFSDGVSVRGETGRFRLVMPWTERAAVVETDAGFSLKGRFVDRGEGLWLLPGRPSLFVRGDAAADGESLRVQGNAVLAWGYDEAETRSRARRFDADAACRESAAFWDAYLASCPLVETGDHTCSDGTVLPAAAIRARQLWAWQVALKNINLLEENRFSCFAAPDKPQWFGVWSNDGAETLAALSLTSAAPLARRALIEYADKAVTPDGVQSWYTHSDGVGCYGNPGDTGRFSHGVPCWVHAVDFYIRAADDAAILSETLDSGGTLWDRIRVYLDRYMERRDVNGDGLVEWVNLWETGWDDKVGPFFSKAPISEWIRRIPTLEGEQIREFYEAFSCPVTPMVEQVYLLWALDGGAHMADLMGEAETAARYRATADRARRAVSETLWDETDGFYHDADVKAGTLSPTKNSDVFYWLYYEPDPLRAGRIVARLLDPAAFGTRCLPMCSLDSEGFRPDGYWCGGHWPREMSYVSLGLARAGRRDLAEDVLLRAICSMPGNRMAEVLDPLTGRQSTAPNNLAYCVLNNVALLDLYGKTRWTDQKGQ